MSFFFVVLCFYSLSRTFYFFRIQYYSCSISWAFFPLSSSSFYLSSLALFFRNCVSWISCASRESWASFLALRTSICAIKFSYYSCTWSFMFPLFYFCKFKVYLNGLTVILKLLYSPDSGLGVGVCNAYPWSSILSSVGYNE